MTRIVRDIALAMAVAIGATLALAGLATVLERVLS